MEKAGMTRWKLTSKALETKDRLSKPTSKVDLGYFSRRFAKNVDALINSRAAHPTYATPYPNYTSLVGDAPPLHRVNNFRHILEAGW